MPSFFPFRALRPNKKQVSVFSSKTSDFNNQEDLVADMISNTESYYYVTKRFLVNDDKKKVEFHFEDGAEFIKEKIMKNELFIDNKPSYFIYRQTDFIKNRSYTGLIGLADINEIENDKIKKHENTKIQREEYLYKQLHYTGVLGEPVLVGYEQNNEISNIIENNITNECEYDFNTIDNKNHKVWKITDSETLEKIYNLLNETNAFYIADGHHRCASVVRNYNLNPSLKNRFFMIFLLDENQLNIGSFHRVISDVGDFRLDELSEKINKNFLIEQYKTKELYCPIEHSEFGLLTRDFSLKLTFINKIKSNNPEKFLDVNILENYIFKEVFNINHPRTDNRLSFFSSNDKISKLKKMLENKEIDMIISNYPVSFCEVKQIADANKVMPPKSTYIEPKLRGGLILQQF